MKTFKKDPTNLTLHVTYRNYRNYCNKLLRDIKSKYENSELFKNKNNLKGTWKVIREICHLDSHNKRSIELLNIKNTPETSVNYVNEYFAGVGKSFAEKYCLTLNLLSVN